jgi:hypothetical protein
MPVSATRRLPLNEPTIRVVRRPRRLSSVALNSASWDSAFISTKVLIEDARNDLDDALDLPSDWDPDGGPPPNDSAGALAKTVLNCLEAEALPPKRLLPLVEGGIGMVFVEGANRAFIESTNSGEVIFMVDSDTSNPEAWEVEANEQSLKTAISRIRVHLAS